MRRFLFNPAAAMCAFALTIAAGFAFIAWIPVLPAQAAESLDTSPLPSPAPTIEIVLGIEFPKRPSHCASLDRERRQVCEAIPGIAHLCGVDAALFDCVVQRESFYDSTAVSETGALGAAQVLPSTAGGFGLDPNLWRENLTLGACYLARQQQNLGHYDGVRGYYAGPNAIRRERQAGGPPRLGVSYARAVLACAERRRATE
jgi:hypothetical protein